jgi:hypothetical protein
MSWFNKRKVTIDTKKEADHERIWTLIDNKDCLVKTFYDSRDVVQYLYDDEFKAKTWIDEKVQHEVAKELVRRNHEKFNKHFTFFLHKDVAPLIVNKMDTMECVGYWTIDKTELFSDMLEVKYDASKQVLFQTSNGVALKED